MKRLILLFLLLATPCLAQTVYLNGLPATSTSLGSVKCGSGSSCATDGTLSVTGPFSSLSVTGTSVLSGTTTFSGGVNATGLASGTVVSNSYLGLNSNNQIVLGAGGALVNTSTQYALAYYSGSTGSSTVSGLSNISTDSAGDLVVTSPRGLEVQGNGFATGTLVAIGALSASANGAVEVITRNNSSNFNLELFGTGTSNRRASILFSSFFGSTEASQFEIGTDSANNGTHNFYWFDDTSSKTPLMITTTDNVQLSGGLITGGYTVSTLPTGTIGMRAYVTDQASACPSPGGVLTGSGSVVCPTFFNGSAWVGD
jgi:hypothetical protein